MIRLTGLDVVNSMVQSHMEMDMMHDAVNGDVLTAISALQNNNLEDIAKAQQDLKEHTTTSEEGIHKIEQLTLSPEVATAEAEVRPAFRAYTAQADTLLKIVAQDAAQGTQEYRASSKDFAQEFEKVEALMADTSDTIGKWSTQIRTEGENTAKTAERNIIIGVIISVALALFTPIYMRFSLFRSIDKLVETAEDLSRENYEREVPFTDRTDEVGQLANALDALRRSASEAYRVKQMLDEMPVNIMTADPYNDFKINYVNQMAHQTIQSLRSYLPLGADELVGQSIDIFYKEPAKIRALLSDHKNLPHRTKINIGPEVLDLQISAMHNKKGDYISPMLAWNIVTKNVELANNFEQSIGSVSNQIALSATGLQQRACVLQGAISQLSAAALEISHRVNDSLKIVGVAVEKGEDARGHMSQLSGSTEKISNVVTLIRSIAEKTNLLALNATIESARAGEAGKGFAVVANEVKTLANQTASAISDITMQMGDIQSFATGTSAAIKEMCDIITEVNGIATTIASTVEEQQAATAEIARSVSGEASGGLNGNESVLNMATQLTAVSGHLQNECEAFVHIVRKM